MKYYVGIDIGGTRIKMGVIDETGKVCTQTNEPTSTKREDLMMQVKHFIDHHKDSYHIEGVGISVPGMVQENGFMKTSGAIKCFLHHNMRDEFMELLKLPVVMENDSKSAAEAERWIGAGKGIDNFVCFTLGTAVGGAIYINGKLHRGLGNMAGEFGVCLVGRESQNYNEQSFSYCAAVVAGLCRNYSYKVKERVLDAKEIYRRAHAHDEIAQACIEEFYHDVAILLVNTAMSVAPDVFLIGGGISSNQEAMDGIKKAYQKVCEDYHILTLIEMPTIQACLCRNDAGMIGAVHAFLSRTTDKK